MKSQPNSLQIITNDSMLSNQTNIKYWNQPSWIAPVTINAVLIVATLWILSSLIHYGKKTNKWSKRRLHDADKLHSGWVYSSIVTCAVMVLIRLITSQIAFNVGFNDPDTCERVCDTLFVEYCLVVSITYVFLWLRQRIFYVNRMLNINFSKTLQFLSSTSLMILLLAGIAVILINVLPRSYSAAATGCIYRIKDNLEYQTYAWMACAVILVIGQVMLVVLLLYPLQKNTQLESSCFCPNTSKPPLKETIELTSPSDSSNKTKETPNGGSCIHSERLKSTCSNESSNSTHRLMINAKSTARVKRVMQRTVIFGSISLATDLILIVLLSTSLLDTSRPGERRFSVMIYDLNLFLNLMLVILSCAVYKDMLFSFGPSAIPVETSVVRRTSTNVSYV